MLEKLSVRGFKTFRDLDLELRPINIFIGANGAGKSNLISLFKMLHEMMRGDFQYYVAKAGGPDMILHYGRKTTPELHITLWFQRDKNHFNGYKSILKPTADTLVFSYEATYFLESPPHTKPYKGLKTTDIRKESFLSQPENRKKVNRYVYEAMMSWEVYHFHDTSEGARVKQLVDITQNARLLADAGNLAAYLYFLREVHPESYQRIVETIRMVAPFFGDFVLRPNPYNPQKIWLEWRERGSDMIFGPQVLSDGTLRFMCLATLFLQPRKKLPQIIILDEPELGLHPYAITLLAEMIHSVSTHTQVLLSTQSESLLSHFSPEDVLVVDRVQGVSTIQRLDSKKLEHWLRDYTLSELWEKNILGGRPRL
jgi:predicted ATPase